MVHKHHLLYDLIRSPSKQGPEFSYHVAKKAFNRCQLYVRRNQPSKPKICKHKSKHHAEHGQRFLAMQNAQIQRLREGNISMLR